MIALGMIVVNVTECGGVQRQKSEIALLEAQNNNSPGTGDRGNRYP
jgi:hypothetical protein